MAWVPGIPTLPSPRGCLPPPPRDTYPPNTQAQDTYPLPCGIPTPYSWDTYPLPPGIPTPYLPGYLPPALGYLPPAPWIPTSPRIPPLPPPDTYLPRDTSLTPLAWDAYLPGTPVAVAETRSHDATLTASVIDTSNRLLYSLWGLVTWLLVRVFTAVLSQSLSHRVNSSPGLNYGPFTQKLPHWQFFAHDADAMNGNVDHSVVTSLSYITVASVCMNGSTCYYATIRSVKVLLLTQLCIWANIQSIFVCDCVAVFCCYLCHKHVLNSFVADRKRNCRKVMFSQASVYSQGRG